MGTLKLLLLVCLTTATTWSFGQQRILKYCVSLFSDTSIRDTIRINFSYKSDLGKHNGLIKVKRVDTTYSVQVFWQRMSDSSNFLTDSYILDTSYNTSIKMFLNDLKSDLKRATSKKILELTTWTYTFAVPNKIDDTFHDKGGIYLYHRLRYNSFLIF
jgi:hypothetical protein